MTADRRTRPGEFPGRALFFAFLTVAAILFISGIDRLVERQFPDPDDVLRLVQVRDVFAGQGWFDPTQYRIDPPHGTPMHWSRLVDAPILFVMVLLTPLVGQAMAETAALIIVPLVTFGLTAAILGRLAWRLLGTRAAIFAVLACGFLPPVLFQFRPMRIDHHGWQIFSVTLALWAISWRDARKGGWVAGLAMAFGLSISLEVLPMAGAFGGVLFLRWWQDAGRRDWLVAFMQALSGGLAFFYLATRGLSPIEYCDAISPAHIAFFLVAALGTWLVAKAGSLRGLALVFLFALVAAAGLGVFALMSPDCLATPFARLDPAVDQFWYRRVLEGQPFWEQAANYVIPMLIQFAAAIGATVVLRMRSHDWLRSWWTDYLLVLVAAFVLSLLVARSAAIAAMIATIPLGWLASSMLLGLRQAASTARKLAIALAFLLLLAPYAPVTLYSMALPTEENMAFRQANLGEAECRVREQVPLLDAIPATTIFTPLDIGPTVLLGSHHSVVATGHHRSEEAMADVINAFLWSPDEAEPIVKRHADYLALCADLTETLLYENGNPEGLGALLKAGGHPDWLEPVDLGQSEQFLLFRVTD
ncbi:hypothetical protein [Qipengyuania sphaerica]|uniref:hypothetical protein n=1 Tax=Qipengyuania sphaerica TaxID=2867243 RepID=UPI001C8845A0|nr:hypothetical protein [Qipengyuania sphaerica]MBX7541634.1 hypothetical protein [Qipengyuania sphaerica]